MSTILAQMLQDKIKDRLKNSERNLERKINDREKEIYLLENEIEWTEWLQKELKKGIQNRSLTSFKSQEWFEKITTEAKRRAKILGIENRLEKGFDRQKVWYCMQFTAFEEDLQKTNAYVVDACNRTMQFFQYSIYENNRQITIAKKRHKELKDISVEVTHGLESKNALSEKEVRVFMELYSTPSQFEKLLASHGTLAEKEAYSAYSRKFDSKGINRGLNKTVNKESQSQRTIQKPIHLEEKRKPPKNASLEESLVYAASQMKVALEQAQAKYTAKIETLKNDIKIKGNQGKLDLSSKREIELDIKQYEKEKAALNETGGELDYFLSVPIPKKDARAKLGILSEIVDRSEKATKEANQEIVSESWSMIKTISDFIRYLKTRFFASHAEKASQTIREKLQEVSPTSDLLPGFDRHKEKASSAPSQTKTSETELVRGKPKPKVK